MQSIKQATIDGFNEFVNGQKVNAVNGDMTLTIFDSESIDVLYTHPVKDIPELTEATYQPRANTPLLDAIGKTINAAKDRLGILAKQPDTVIVVIMTDGLENASHEFKLADIRALVKEQETNGWQFVFLGANMDAYAEGMNLGMQNAQYVSYAATPDSVSSTMAYASAAVTRSANTGGQSWTSENVDTKDGTVKKRSTPLP
jgi:hypothetical protein